MVQQGRLLAAALGGEDTIERARVDELLSRIGQRGDARLRVYDSAATLLADSNALGFGGASPSAPEYPDRSPIRRRPRVSGRARCIAWAPASSPHAARSSASAHAWA